MMPLSLCAAVVLLHAASVQAASSEGVLTKIELPTGPSMPVCNDGSPYVYYVEVQDPQSSSWILFQQGGGYCFDEYSCKERASTMSYLTTSNGKPSQLSYSGGVLSSSPTENPNFHNWNHVYLPYCTSDGYAGTAESSEFQWRFLGSRVVPAVIHDLKENYGLSDAADTTLVYSGASAGAVGLYPNMDLISETLLPHSNVLGLVDSGWFLDSEPYVPRTCNDTMSCTEQECLQKGAQLWQPQLDAECSAAKTNASAWECFMGYHVAEFISTRMFIFQFRFDLAQMDHDGIENDPSQAQDTLTYARESAQHLTETFSSAWGTKKHFFFAPSCYHHVIMNGRNPSWNALSIGGVLLTDAIDMFVNGTKDGLMQIDDCDSPGCNPTCP